MSKLNNESAPVKTQSTFDERNDPDDLPPPYESAGPSHSNPPQQQYQPQSSYPPQHNSYPGAYYQANLAQQPPFQSPFPYPQGYYCPACRNTGIKTHNGHPCGQCERLFGRQNANVMYAPMHPHQSPGITYIAGDPRIGGRLCGNCKGRGVRSSMFGMVEEQCFVCRGIGRIL